MWPSWLSVTVRTLHHYDEIGLVRPSSRTAAGYRAYSAGDVERLREVLAYRRLGFGLREVAVLVDDPATDAVAHLRRLRGLLLDQRDRAAAMVTAIDRELEARAMGIRTTPEEQLKMFGARLYDAIGSAYPATRRTEPRIAAQIWAALGDARTVLNVGAGTGSYEPPDRDVTAVEPSAVMRAQRPAGAAPCVAAAAESLPFEDRSFDAAMAVSTVHHWPDAVAGLREMRRVARRVVVFTYDADDPGWLQRFWLTRDYLPEFAGLVTGRPSLADLARRDRGPHGAGADTVGLRRRLLRGTLAPARGVPGRTGAPRGVGVDPGRPAGRAAGGEQAPRRPRLGPVGRAELRARHPRRGGARPTPARGLNPAPSHRACSSYTRSATRRVCSSKRTRRTDSTWSGTPRSAASACATASSFGHRYTPEEISGNATDRAPSSAATDSELV
nr:hypothetical protein GCM10020092_070220 [Actinoplanes digitatis]